MRASRKKAVNTKAAKTKTAPPVDKFTSLPDRWFRDPFREKLFKLVRPVTARTRRKQLRIVCQLPEHLVMEWLAQLQPGDAQGLARGSDGELIPTGQSAGLRRYTYTIRKGSVSDKLFNFQSDNLKSRLGLSARPRATRGRSSPTRGGSAARSCS